MKLAELLQEIIEELDRLHTEGNPINPAEEWAGGFLNFVRAQNGAERHFSKKAQRSLRTFATRLHQADVSLSQIMEVNEVWRLARKAIADLHADGQFTQGSASPIKLLRQRIAADAAEIPRNFTHYFPVFAFDLGMQKPFIIGPVTLFSREQWIERVDFSDAVKERYANAAGANHGWKDVLREALSEDEPVGALEGLADEIHGIIKDSNAIASISLSGYEWNLSHKVAGLICKSALDGISLILGGGDHFLKQALGHERMPPLRSGKLGEIDGFLWASGLEWSKRRNTLSPGRLNAYVRENSESFAELGGILRGLSNPEQVKHPNLCNRWATALEWLAEGCRESNDAIGLAKIGTSLDILSGGGTDYGIKQMLVNLTGWTADTVVVSGVDEMTLQAVVRMIYNSGRSQILHGTHYKRLLSFSSERDIAAQIARLALLLSAERLTTYQGADDDTKAFQTISAASS